MKVTLAIVLAVLLVAGQAVARRQSSQPQSQMPQPSGAQGAPQQGTPPPCAPSKDTCDVVEPEPQSPSGAAAAKPQGQQSKPAAKKSRKKKKTAHPNRSAKQGSAQDPSNPKKTVVREGGTSDPKAVLTPGATAQTNYSRQMTADLLSATDANLKQATLRPLSADQEQTVTQIKLFMEQANDAMKAGDLDRGHNLAIKAHLLSDDLVKH